MIKKVMTQHNIIKTLRRTFRVNKEGLVLVDNTDANGELEFHWQLSDNEWIHLISDATIVNERDQTLIYDAKKVTIKDFKYIGVASAAGGYELKVDRLNSKAFYVALREALETTNRINYNPFEGRADLYELVAG